MDLYLDDDSADRLLARLLRTAGHDVRLPVDIGQGGSPDAVHLKYAIRENRVLLSRNHDDFLWLHELIAESRGRYPGIIIVRRDNNPRRDLTARGIVTALANLIESAVQVADQFTILNQWR
jgi:predicted nuclease of predicted toxin-antitoxin system